MPHEAWHVFVLVGVIAGAGAAILLAVTAVIPELDLPAGRLRRPWLWGMTAFAVLLVIYEWTKVH